MLLTIACYDAFGRGYEFIPQNVVEAQNTLKCYRLHALDHNPPGSYTDDCQMSIGVAELLLSEEDWTPLNIANSFVRCFKRDPRASYSKGFLSVLQKVKDGKELLSTLKPHSERNGAAMRSCPMGYEPDIDRLLEMAEVQAKITHDTEGGVTSSQAVALAAHYALYQLGPMSEVGAFVRTHIKGPWEEKWKGRVPCHGVKTVQAVFHVLRNAKTMSEVLKQSIAFGGDTDSTAAIAGGCAGASQQYENDLPEFLLRDLENGKYGRDYILKLDFALWKEYGVGKPEQDLLPMEQELK